MTNINRPLLVPCKVDCFPNDDTRLQETYKSRDTILGISTQEHAGPSNTVIRFQTFAVVWIINSGFLGLLPDVLFITRINKYCDYNRHQIQEEEAISAIIRFHLNHNSLSCFIHTVQSRSANTIDCNTGFKQTTAVLDKSSLVCDTIFKWQRFALRPAYNHFRVCSCEIIYILAQTRRLLRTRFMCELHNLHGVPLQEQHETPPSCKNPLIWLQVNVQTTYELYESNVDS
jgi:hypothetical protein